MRARARRAVFVGGGMRGVVDGRGGRGWAGAEVVGAVRVGLEEVVGRRKRCRIVHCVITGREVSGVWIGMGQWGTSYWV